MTLEARQKKVQKRRDTKTAELEDIRKDELERKAEGIREQSEFMRKLGKEKQDFRKKKRELVEREKKLRERELSLEQQELAVENESLRQIINDMAAYQHEQTLQQKDLPNGHALIVEDGPNAFGSPPWVSARTPSLPKTSPATSPLPTSPPPVASSPPSSPVQSPCHQPKIPSNNAANDLTYSCIKCTKPDNQLMIACQNRKECLSRKWGQGLGGIHSGSDAWFHISHLGITEANLYELTQSKEDWYCPLCQKPMDNTDPDEDTMTEPRSPRCQRPIDKFELVKRRRQEAELRRQAELLRQAETYELQKPTTTKRCREAETYEPQKPTTTKRRRRARTPKSKESTNSEKAPKKSNRRKQVRWTNPLERAALIDAMRTVIYAHDQTERRYVTASQLMLARGFDRSRHQIKNKWNRAVRDEAQRQGVPEDRHEKAGMKIVTGVQDPADRKRKRREEREAKQARERVVELGMMEWDTEKLVEEMGEASGEQEAGGEEDADGEDDFEEHGGNHGDNEDDEEERPQSKKQRFS